MSCPDCSKANNILRCITTLTVGTAASHPNTDVYLYIRNNTTGRLYRYEVTTSNTGLISKDISAQQYMDGHNYELWVTLASATNIDDRITFTVGSENVTCITLGFETVYADDDTLESSAQTITLES